MTDEKSVSIVHQSPHHSPLTVPPIPTKSTLQQDHCEAEGSRGEGPSSRNRGDSSKDIIGVSSSDEEMRMQLEGLEVDIGREQSAQGSSARKNTPVSVSYSLSPPPPSIISIDIFLFCLLQSSFVYSSKPPSLYGGPKPSPQCSSRPTTVSLMLSRGGGGRGGKGEEGHAHHSTLPARPRTQQGKYTSTSHTNSSKKRKK